MRLIGPMRPRLDKVGGQQNQKQFDEKWQVNNQMLQGFKFRPTEKSMNQKIDDQQYQANQKVIDHEMREIGLPTRAKYRLRINRPQLFNGDKNHCRAEQIKKGFKFMQVGDERTGLNAKEVAAGNGRGV